MASKLQQCGTWPSLVTTKMLAATIRLNDVQWDTSGSTLVWHEGRGAQGVLVAQSGVDAPRELTTDLSVRAQVGYGGGDFTVAHGNVYFAGTGGRLYCQPLSAGAAHPITPAFGSAASPVVSADGQWLAYVHSGEGIDSLALVDTSGIHWPRQIATGFDFVMQPSWHPATSHLVYVAWKHPNMPWDGTELHLISLTRDTSGFPVVVSDHVIAGNTTTSVQQPLFSLDGRYLTYISDETGWNQIYLYDMAEQTVVQLTVDEADHAGPAWVQGVHDYGWSHTSKSLFFVTNRQGFFTLSRYDIELGTDEPISDLSSYTEFEQISVSPVADAIAMIASSSVISRRIISYSSEKGVRIHKRATSESVSPTSLSQAQALTWLGHDRQTVHGIYYPPASDTYVGIGAPPLIVDIHGGPTGQVNSGYAGVSQFFATRGFALLYVNHRGSTGYGKDYINMLRGNWGIYDVEDAASGAQHLAALGLADPTRFIIMGGSAGGFTVLQSLIVKQGFYKAGICSYGVANHFLLASETHKFEERYLDSLLGPLPDAAAIYRERSPYFHANRIIDPIAVFQGEDDPVVPKNQSDGIVASLRARGIPHEYHVYPGEGHGWRKPETVEAYLTAVLKFLRQYVIYA